IERRGEARRALGLTEGERLLLLVGNDLNTKGADVAIAALARLPVSYRLGLAGRVPRSEVQALSAAAGVANRVIPLPHADDVLAYYAAADVLVAPSRADSFHLPALEAMACGLPVIVSERAGVA